jgi:polyhydroxybutyrate depolymerase
MRAHANVAALLSLGAAACADAHRPLPASWATSAESAAKDASGGPIMASGSPACGKPSGKTGVLSEHVTVFGKSRSYAVVVPPGYDAARSYPIVFVLHVSGGSGAAIRTAFGLEAVTAEHAILVYPDAQHGGWDLDSEASKNPDVALFDAMLARTQTDYCIDLHRVFVTGFSNGAYMANQLACRRGDRIRAVASHAGGGPYEVKGTYDDSGHLLCKGAVASLVVHGTADTTVAPSEGQNTIDHVVFANHCSGQRQDAKGCVEYQDCTHAVITCKVPGLGHGLWTQAARMTWDFFDRQQ